MAILWDIIQLLFTLLLMITAIHLCGSSYIMLMEKRLASFRKWGKETIGDYEWPSFAFFLGRFLFLEYFANLALPFLGIFAFGKEPPKTEKQLNGQTPIVLVHGFAHNKTAWMWFKSQLEKEHDLGPVYAFNLHPLFRDIQYYASQVDDEVQKILKETGSESVILIGHSMGGLIAAYYKENLARKGQVEKIITIGTPFQGTRAAAMAYGDCVAQMAEDAPFLKGLRSQIEESELTYCCVASEWDNIIVPWKSALIKNAETFVLDDIGHLTMLYSADVISRCVQWIRHDPGLSISKAHDGSYSSGS